MDDLGEDAFTVSNGENEASLVIANIGGERRKLSISGLSNEISGCKFVQKKGKSPTMVQLKPTKKEEKPWYALGRGFGRRRRRR